MDERQARIQEDLRGLIVGEIRCDDLFVELFASDASIYQVRPLGVVRPRNTADVVACVQYAGENQIPIHARGAGTGLAGQALGPGLVIDFSRYLRRIIRTNESTVRVQPGVVLERLNAHLKPMGRCFGPDPAAEHVTTIGGVLGVDSGGSRWLKYGSAASHVESVQVVLADGSLLELGREPLNEAAIAAPLQNGNDTHRRRQLVGEIAELLRTHAQAIANHRPRSLVNTSGYNIWHVLKDDTIDMSRMLCGSEGTLCLTTEVTLRTCPLPKQRSLALLFFDSLETAARAVAEVTSFEPASCDLMDRRLLSLARDMEPRYDLLIPADAEALLLVEFGGNDPVEVRDSARKVVERVRRRKKLAFDARTAYETDEIALLWQLARTVVPTLYRLKGTTRPLPCVEDIAIPPERLPELLVALQNVLKDHQVTASLFAHAGHGQLHLRPFLDLANNDDVTAMSRLANDLYGPVVELGGTISGEHGDGLSRTAFLRRQYGPLYDVFREVKRIFDPHNIFNPGKVIGEDPDLMTRNLRPVPSAPPRSSGVEETPAAEEAIPEPIDLQLNWDLAEIMRVTRSCNGCGVCRSQAADVRMCPLFRIVPAEEASPRAKANMLRSILTGQLEPEQVASEALKEVADLCVNCQMCRLECPARVDIPRLMIETKGNFVATNGLRFSDWVVSRIDGLSRLGSRMRPLSNRAIASPMFRWLIEKTMGIAQGRKLPRFASQSFMRRARRRRLTRRARHADPKVLYFVDTYANYHDPQLAEAFVAVLEHHGVSVYVHPGQRASGMSMVACGSLEAARRVARENVRLLAESVRQGYEVVATEPSAVLCLKREYPALVDEEDAQFVADHTSEACDYLWRMHRSGNLKLKLRPISATIAYHTPCHLIALENGTPGENLLRLIPGLRVLKTEQGCSGMAGTYGLKGENYRRSLRAGWGLISAIRQSGWQAGTTECSACKIQMEQGTHKPTIHPLKLLALSYGLLPDEDSPLKAQSQELVVT